MGTFSNLALTTGGRTCPYKIPEAARGRTGYGYQLTMDVRICHESCVAGFWAGNELGVFLSVSCLLVNVLKIL